MSNEAELDTSVPPAGPDAGQDVGHDASLHTSPQAGASNPPPGVPAPAKSWAGGRIGSYVALVAGVVGLLAIVGHNTHSRWSVPLGLLFTLSAAGGLMDAMGTFDRVDLPARASTDFARLNAPLLSLALTIAAFTASLAGSVLSGRVPQIVWGLLVTTSFIALTAATFRLGVALGPLRTDEAGLERPLLMRHGFWVVVISAVLYLPCMGSFSLWDPWETHYGEVAREMIARDDWISLWWAQDGWFFSKPILNFWIQGLAMSLLGVRFEPDKWLVGDGSQPAMHPEWAVRAPVVLMTIAALYVLYKGVSKHFGRRAGLLGALVLATMPDWYFLAHQTMTDMPFVAPLAAAMGFLLIGMGEDPEQLVSGYVVTVGRRTFKFTGWHLIFGAILLCAIPQIAYLVSRNLSLLVSGPGPKGFQWHWDSFRSGSGMGNCGLPGNEACNVQRPVFPEWYAQPILQGLLWAGLLGGLLVRNAKEHRTRRLFYLAAWLCAAISTMGKGPAGIVLPVLCAGAYIASKKRWEEITRLELVSGLLIVATVALPWFIAMYVRHGAAFVNRLIVHDMINRVTDHVHDTNEGDDTSFRFYIWQLGYALFPWTAFAPAALVHWLKRNTTGDDRRADGSVLLFMWFLFVFALFSFAGTKFHHYIFPAVPAVAMLIGVMLDELLPKAGIPSREKHTETMLAASLFGGALLLGIIGRDLTTTPATGQVNGAIRLLQLFTYNYTRPWAENLDFHIPLLIVTGLGAVLCLVAIVRPWRVFSVPGFVALAFAAAIWGLDVYMVKTAPHWGQRELFEAYYRDRASADAKIVAYQMNWKGENIYTGNKIPAFVSSGAPFTEWVKKERERGARTVYFVTEHSRVSGLKREAGAKNYVEITTKELCNKFVVVRAEL